MTTTINLKKVSGYSEVGNLPVGTMFLHSSEVYIKIPTVYTQDAFNEEANAVFLHNGALAHFDDNKLVVKTGDFEITQL